MYRYILVHIFIYTYSDIAVCSSRHCLAEGMSAGAGLGLAIWGWWWCVWYVHIVYGKVPSLCTRSLLARCMCNGLSSFFSGLNRWYNIWIWHNQHHIICIYLGSVLVCLNWILVVVLLQLRCYFNIYFNIYYYVAGTNFVLHICTRIWKCFRSMFTEQPFVA